MNRFLSTTTRISNLIQFTSIIKPTSILQPSSSSSFLCFQFSSHTSNSSSHPNSSTPQTTISESSTSHVVDDDDDSTTDDVTTEELKHRIDRFFKGDVEALSSIFEAILARKLSGKHEDTDDEIMEEFRSKTEQVGDQMRQSDEDYSGDDLTDSDEEFSD